MSRNLLDLDFKIRSRLKVFDDDRSSSVSFIIWTHTNAEGCKTAQHYLLTCFLKSLWSAGTCQVHGTLSNWNYLITDKDDGLTEPVFYSAGPWAIGRRPVDFPLLIPGLRVLYREGKEYMPCGVAIDFVHAHSNAFEACQKIHKAGKPKKLQHVR